MRRKHRILLAAFAALALLAVTAGVANEGGARSGAATSAAERTKAEATSTRATSNVTGTHTVNGGGATPFTDTGLTEPLDSPSMTEPRTTELAADTKGCAASGHSAVVDRAEQRAWLCDNGEVTHKFVMTSARSQPDPGTYKVYAKDLNSSSILTGKFSTMTHFVAFTRGEHTGARIAFHSIPKYADGSYVQPLDSVGAANMRGASSGCIRVLHEDSVKIWDWLSNGDPVTVIS